MLLLHSIKLHSLPFAVSFKTLATGFQKPRKTRPRPVTRLPHCQPRSDRCGEPFNQILVCVPLTLLFTNWIKLGVLLSLLCSRTIQLTVWGLLAVWHWPTKLHRRGQTKQFILCKRSVRFRRSQKPTFTTHTTAQEEQEEAPRRDMKNIAHTCQGGISPTTLTKLPRTDMVRHEAIHNVS